MVISSRGHAPPAKRNTKMTEDLRNELKAAGYTEAQIAREAAYLKRVAWENERIGSEAGWNFGLYHAGEEEGR
jgi:hypothetical protein